MIVLAIFASLAAISILSWLMFTLPVYALPVCLGVSAGILAHVSGTDTPSAIAIGLVTAVSTLFVVQFLLHLLTSVWLRLFVLIAFVVPAAIAGYCATFGIVQHFVSPPFGQIAISLIDAIAVCAPAWLSGHENRGRLHSSSIEGPEHAIKDIGRTPDGNFKRRSEFHNGGPQITAGMSGRIEGAPRRPVSGCCTGTQVGDV